mgnify:CR=1 FL=1|tara:strand:- start:957 stop:2759 length:1803 start_codon:yes stop_codon:yes gene_type:complete
MYIAIGNMITSSSQMSGAAASGGGGSRETKLVFEVTVDASSLTFKIDTGVSAGFEGTNYNVSWGDGSSDSAQDHDITHTYSSAGTYEIKIDGRFLMNNQSAGTTNSNKITKFKNWGTAECEFVSLYRMFYKCVNMTYEATDYPNISNISTTGTAPHFTETFRECESIVNLDLSNWQNTNNLNKHNTAFMGMDNLETLNMTGWDLSNSTNTSGMFQEIGKLTTNGCLITAPNLNISHSSNTNALLNMFQAAKLVTGSDFTNWTLPTVAHSWFAAFYLVKGSGFATIDLTSWSNKNPSSLYRTFRGVNDPTGNINQTATINLTGIDTSSCTSFRDFVRDNRFLTNVVGFSALDSTATTGNSIDQAFTNCNRLTNINEIPSTFWQNLDMTGGTQGLKGTFSNLGNQVAGFANPPNFGTATFSTSQSFSNMFQQAKFNATIDTSGFRFTSANQAPNMFYLSVGIGDVDASNWGITSSITSLRNFTRDSDDITAVNFGTGTSTNDFSGVTTFQEFTRLSEVTSIDFPTNADFSSVTNMTNFAHTSQQVMSTAQYDNFLVRFDATNSNSGITISMGTNTFTNGSAAATARANIIARGNTITDGGGV